MNAPYDSVATDMVVATNHTREAEDPDRDGSWRDAVEERIAKTRALIREFTPLVAPNLRRAYRIAVERCQLFVAFDDHHTGPSGAARARVYALYHLLRLIGEDVEPPNDAAYKTDSLIQRIFSESRKWQKPQALRFLRACAFMQRKTFQAFTNGSSATSATGALNQKTTNLVDHAISINPDRVGLSDAFFCDLSDRITKRANTTENMARAANQLATFVTVAASMVLMCTVCTIVTLKPLILTPDLSQKAPKTKYARL